MKVLVISDTHGCTSVIDGLIRDENPDVLFHLGDMQTDLKMSLLARTIPTYSVPGNCDNAFSTAGAEICVELGGVRFFALHGHTRNMRLDPTRGIYAALEQNAGVLLYGHTHTPLWDNHMGLTVINPGTARLKGAQPATYAVINIENGKVNGRILPVLSKHLFETDF
ncbi:MAG: YfcE family phosphodiesterase [Clostridia bacterium]|nr:YfcE family phosphodiesterase [Clostridia bacterium]